MPDNDDTFGDMLSRPEDTHTPCNVTITYERPAALGGGTYVSPYDMASAVDLWTINRNISHGYRVVTIEEDVR